MVSVRCKTNLKLIMNVSPLSTVTITINAMSGNMNEQLLKRYFGDVMDLMKIMMKIEENEFVPKGDQTFLEYLKDMIGELVCWVDDCPVEKGISAIMSTGYECHMVDRLEPLMMYLNDKFGPQVFFNAVPIDSSVEIHLEIDQYWWYEVEE